MPEPRPPIIHINPASLPDYPRLSWAVQAGGLLFLSGIVSIDDTGNVVGAGDAERQAHTCLDTIADLLREAGTHPDNIVKLTCFATTVQAARAYIAARGARFQCRAAATTVMVSALLNPAYMLEIEAVAVVDA